MSRTYTIPKAFTEEQISADFTGSIQLLNQIICGSLVQEPDAIGPNRGPLTRWVGYYFGKPRMTKTEAMTELGVEAPNYIANLEAGDPNPFFGFIDSLNQSGNDIIREGDFAYMTPNNDDDLYWINFQRLLLLIATGGDLKGYPMFFEIDDITTPCPFAPDDLVDENDEILPQETWETWGTYGESHKPRQVGDKWYRSNSVGFSGERMPASQWVNWYVSPPLGVRIITVDEYKTILDSQVLPE
jgi:hypothetical protein